MTVGITSAPPVDDVLPLACMADPSAGLPPRRYAVSRTGWSGAGCLSRFNELGGDVA